MRNVQTNTAVFEHTLSDGNKITILVHSFSEKQEGFFRSRIISGVDNVKVIEHGKNNKEGN